MTETLSPESLRRICDFLYRRTGMAYGEAKRYYIERRVTEQMTRAGAVSFAAYLALVQADAAEAERLINSFTVNETYFYREAHQLRCLSRALLPEIAARRRPGDLIRIWSVPCSTGEEPYSLAIWLLENWALVDAYNIEIIGSDIDTAALAAAARGIYGARALTRLPAALVARYFCAGGRRRLADHPGYPGIGDPYPGQPDRSGRDRAAGPVRCDLLPQRADLFRRGLSPERGRGDL